MKVTLTKTTILNGIKKVETENLKSDDIRLELLRDRNGSQTSWNILGYYYFDKCSQTKYGYRVTETQLQHKKTNEIIINKFLFY
jgi:hypothetical protein